jgi:hypothetical protein
MRSCSCITSSSSRRTGRPSAHDRTLRLHASTVDARERLSRAVTPLRGHPTAAPRSHRTPVEKLVNLLFRRHHRFFR